MKRLILILALVVVSTISYGQGSKYNVTKVSFAHHSGDKITLDEEYPTTNLHLTMNGEYVFLDDKSGSIYKQAGEIDIRDMSNVIIATYMATDVKGNKVICSIVLTKETKRLYFYIVYGNDVIIYDLEDIVTGLQNLE